MTGAVAAWRCSTCGAGFAAEPTPTLDPSIGMGYCLPCGVRRPMRRVPVEPFAAGMRGSELAADHRSTGLERMEVDRAIRSVAARGEEFTADEVWAELGGDFPVTKGLAARLNVAVRDRVIVATGRVAISRRPGEHGHAQRLAVWRPI